MMIAEAVHIEAAPERESPYNRTMAVWVSWMKLKDCQTTGGWGHPQDSKEFMTAGEAVDVMIDDLPRIQWWAIRKAHGITTVWRFPDHSFADALAEAEEKLTPKMRNNLATRRFFN